MRAVRRALRRALQLVGLLAGLCLLLHQVVRQRPAEMEPLTRYLNASARLYGPERYAQLARRKLLPPTHPAPPRPRP